MELLFSPNGNQISHAMMTICIHVHLGDTLSSLLHFYLMGNTKGLKVNALPKYIWVKWIETCV